MRTAYTFGNKTYRNILIAVIPVLGVAVSILVSSLNYYSDEKLMRTEFNEDVENRFSALRREIDSNLDVLASLQALYYVSKDVDSSEFRNFTNHFLKQHASIQALEWIPRVPDSRREAYETAARREGSPVFQFTERIAQGKMKRAEKRKEYFPVYFVEPYKGNEVALGFDLASNPTRREALEVAGKAGEMLATARITLVQETKNQVGFIVFAPVYRKGVLLRSDRERWESLEGFALGVFRINDIVEKAMNYLKPEGIDFFIYDVSAPEKERFLYTHASRTRKTPLLNKDQPETRLRTTMTLEVAGRKWLILYSATPDFIAARSSRRPWEILLAGLLVTGLVTGFLISSVRHAEHVEKSAKNLSDANGNLANGVMERKRAEAGLTLFRNLIDRANDSILVVDPETGRLWDVNDKACNVLGYGREELLKMTALDIAAPTISDIFSWRAHVNEVKDKGHLVMEAGQRRKDGGTFPVEINVNYISFEAQDYMVAIIRDITERKRAEEALKSLNLRHAAILTAVPDIIMEVDNNKVYVWTNKAGYEFFGDDVIGKKAAFYFEDEQQTYNIVQPLFDGNKEMIYIESWQRRKDGEKRLLAWWCRTLKDSEGNIIGALSTARDVTERRRMEKALVEEKTFTENALNTISDTFFVFDLNGKFLRWNNSLSKVTGYSDEEIKMMKPTDFFPQEEVPKVQSAIERVVRDGHATLETTISTKDGRRFPYDLRGAILLDHEERGVGICGVGRDITERKKAEEDLRKSEEFIKNILETVDEGFIVIDPEYKIISANKSYLNMLNKSEENVIGEYCYKLTHRLCKPCCEVGDDCAVSRTLKTGTPQTAAHAHRDEAGHPIFVETKSFPVRDVSGKVVAAIEVINNITEKKKLEDQLRHSQKMEAIGNLAGGVAHDFNNILNVIIGYGTMVMDRLRDDRLSREQINEVLAAADRAANLTKRLLAFSRKQVVDMKPVNVNEIILGIEKMLSRIIGEDIVFAIELAGRKTAVMADSRQIEQVLMNLISNAHDAMPKGGRLTISTGIKEVDDAYIAAYGYGETGTYALICVTDTGGGMDAETQKKIFEPFFTTKGIGEGTGLGLAIAYGIIKKHDGYIQVYSEVGKGTTFKILLPVIKEETSKMREVEAAAAIKGGTETILIAEDDASLRKLSRIILESFGYSVITADDGEDAITKYEENRDKIQLVVLDMIMPKKNGKEVYEEIRKISPDIKTLFMSGYAMDIITKKELLGEGMDFIFKPVPPKDLLKKVRDALDR